MALPVMVKVAVMVIISGKVLRVGPSATGIYIA